MVDEIKNMDMDWDSPISAEASERSEQNLPPAGEYGFTVIEFEKTVSQVGKKTVSQVGKKTVSQVGKKMAKIKLELDEEGQHWKVYDYLVLTTNMEWKLAQFFECLGLKKKGESLSKMPWDKVLGAKGRMKIKHETYKGKESCKVDHYLISEAAKASTAPQMPFEV